MPRHGRGCAENLPLIGRWTDRGRLCTAVWVTHSVGAAQVLTALLTEGSAPVASPESLDPRRFETWTSDAARAASLWHYNDIYDRG